MNWRDRFGYAVLAGFLVSGIATIGPVFLANRVAVHVVAPIVALPLVFRVLFDIVDEYDLVPQSTPQSVRGYAVESGIGGVVGAAGLYSIYSVASFPSVVVDRLLFIAFFVEWFVADQIISYRIRSSSR